jgi:hypothetical protein
LVAGAIHGKGTYVLAAPAESDAGADE